MEDWQDACLNLLYPRRCPFCLAVIERRQLLCDECKRTLRPISGPRCFCCGRKVGYREEYCPDCLHPRGFREGRGIFLYDGRMRRSVMAYKDGGNRLFARTYARAMAGFGRSYLERLHPEVFVGIPLYKRTLAQRGFNQSALLARELSDLTGVPSREDLLFKEKKTAPQKSLKGSARRKNLSGAFRASREAEGLSICLVDDVYTTGSTLEEAARTLYFAGAREVTFLTLCQVDPRGEGEEEEDER